MTRPCVCDDRRACRLCHLYHTDPAYRALWGGSPAAAPLPCRHLGEATGAVVPCGTCPGAVRLKTFRCELYGSCTTTKPAPGTACCVGCPDNDPDTFRLVAPLGTADQPARWEGRARRRPWHYPATVLLPHLDTVEHLEACIELLRLQTVPLYVVVVDTGSPPAACERVERLRSGDCEVHYVRGNGYTHSSEPVAVALARGRARVNTEKILLLHTDVFLTRRDSAAWLLGQCSAACPAVGWEMSPRQGTDLWRGMVSHTFTALHAPTLRRLGVSWHMQRGRDLLGLGLNYAANGFPDTETALNMCLREAGVTPKILGGELNYQRQTTGFWDHARSSAGLKAYSPGTALHRRVEGYAAAALAEAVARAAAWRAGRYDELEGG
jgi:hypothetical protein